MYINFSRSIYNVVEGLRELPFCILDAYATDANVSESFAFARKSNYCGYSFEEVDLWQTDINGYVMQIVEDMYINHTHGGCAYDLYLNTGLIGVLDESDDFTDGSTTDVEVEIYSTLPDPFVMVRVPTEGRDFYSFESREEFSIQSGYVRKIAMKIFKDRLPDQDYVVRLVEDVLVTVHHVVRARNKFDYMMAFATFLKFRMSGPIMSNENLTLIKDYFEKLFFVDGVQSGEIQKARDYLTRYTEMKNSAIFVKLYRFMMYLLSFSILDKAGVNFNTLNYNKMETEAIRLKYNSRVDFAECLMDTLIFICERGQQCYLTGTMDPIFHSESKYDEWFQKCLKLKREFQFLGDPESNQIDPFAFESDLDDVIEKGRAIYKYAMTLGELEKKTIGKMLHDMQLIKMTFNSKKTAQRKRRVPFSTLIYGASGVAKSKFLELGFCQYAKLMDLRYADEYIYTRSPADPNWSSFTSSKWGCILDDIGFIHPNKAPNGDPTCMELIQIVNDVAFTPPQAALEDKGRTPVRFRFVQGTSNAMDMNCPSYFSSPLAAQRRLPYIINLVPKGIYTRDGVMIDPELLPILEEGDYPDFWNISIYKVVPQGDSVRNQRAGYELIAEYDNIYDYVLWLNKAALKHEEVRDKADNCSRTMAEIKLCEGCKVPEKHCACNLCLSCGRVSCICNSFDPQRLCLCCDVPLHNCRNRNEYTIQTNYVIRRRTNGEQYVAPINEMTVFEEYETDNYRVFDDRREAQRVIHEEEAVDMFEAANEILEIEKERAFARGWMDYIYLHLIGLFITFYLDITFFRSSMDYIYSWPIIRRALKKTVDTTVSDSRVVQQICKKLGKKIGRKIGNLRICAIVVTVLGAGATIVWLINKCVTLYQSKHEDADEITDTDLKIEVRDTGIGRRPQPRGNERENVWHNENVHLSTLDVTPQIESAKGQPITQFLNKVLDNCVHMRFKVHADKTHYKINKAFCVGGRLYVTNKHALPARESFETEMIWDSTSKGVTANSTIILDKRKMYFQHEKDLVFFMIDNMNAKKSLVDYFAQKSINGIFNGYYVSKEKHGYKYLRNLVNIRLEMRNTDLGTIPTWMSLADKVTDYGDCGAVLVAETGRGPAILGFHYLGGATGSVGAIHVTREDIISAVGQFPQMIQSGFVKLSMPSMKRGLVELHEKAAVRFLSKGNMQAFGSITGSRTKPKSVVMRTALNELLTKHGYETKYTAPDMGWRPWHLALKDMCEPANMFNPYILDECVKAYVDDIYDGLEGEEVELLHVYDDMTAINGRPGIAYVDKINRNTSTGFPWNTTKRKFLLAIEGFEDIADPVELTDEMFNEVEFIISLYKQGIRYNPVFSASLKDEPVTERKSADGKTRVFTGSPLPWSIVVRKYFLSLVRCLQRNKILFESMPGMKCQSREWGEFYKFLTKFGRKRMVAGDYRKFDKKMSAKVILAAFEILIEIARRSGNFSAEDILVMRCIAEDTAFAYVNFNGDLYAFFGSNPSGHPLTVIINCLANCLYLRYAYYNLNPEKECRSFKQNVANGTYGDDDVMGVSEWASWFNHTTISDFLASVGIEFTMADKESASIPYIDIDEVSFLKRGWRWDEDVKAFLCPLEHDSIEKMLMVCVQSRSITREQQAIEVVDTAVREYFFYGKNVFEEKRRLLSGVLDEAGLTCLMLNPLPTWEDLVSAY